MKNAIHIKTIGFAHSITEIIAKAMDILPPSFVITIMTHDKISSGINSQEKGFNRILEEAAAESRRISLAIQKIAGTTSCKGVQIHELISL